MMHAPFQTHRELCWATWRVDMMAICASTAAGFAWVFGMTSSLAMFFIAFDIDVPAGDESLVFPLVYLLGLFGVGMLLMNGASWIVYRRFGIVCPSCNSRLDCLRKQRECLAEGCCPTCGKPMTTTSPDQFLSHR